MPLKFPPIQALTNPSVSRQFTFNTDHEIALPAVSLVLIGTGVFVVPAGSKLVLSRVAWAVGAIGGTTLQAQVYVTGSDAWKSTVEVGEDTPDLLVYDNSGGSADALEGVAAYVYNTDSGASQNLLSGATVWVNLRLE